MRIISCILLFLLVVPANAQIKGTVKDKEGEPVIAANLFWMGTTNGAVTGEDGGFSIDRSSRSNLLIFSLIGYKNDTIKVTGETLLPLEVVLREESHLLGEVNITARRKGLLKMQGVVNSEMITSAELLRAACCNLGESFTTNPSVDVSYSDASTGAKQIKLLGLSGSYVQLLTENIPNYRGAAAPYSLGYVPGPWMQSIQVSKGTSSVKNGYEAIAGQINIEFKKPQGPESVSANLYGSLLERYEANVDANKHLNNRLSTGILLHYENDTKGHDKNGDGFMDMPKVEQYNLQNRWAYMGNRYVFQGVVKALGESRVGGQTDMDMGKPAIEPGHNHSVTAENGLYRIDIDTKRYEAFTKHAFIFDKANNGSVALILSGSYHRQDASFGHKIYNVDQKNFYASLMYESDFTPRHNLSAGLSFNYDHYKEDYRLTNLLTDLPVRRRSDESVPGAYVQYTYNLNGKLILMGGLRGDYSSNYRYFVTPRVHVKYIPSPLINVGVSAGKGYRTPRPLAENNYLLASSRSMVIADNLKQEEAWNFGGSVNSNIPLLGKTLTLGAEYYYTDFKNQLVVDLNSDPHQVIFSNLSGSSYSHTLQVEASYPFFEGFTLTGAYRYMDVKTTYNGEKTTKPLTNRYKGLLTASYQTPLGKWQLDGTWQQNGKGKLPSPYTLEDGSLSWNTGYKAYGILNMQVTRFFRRWSVYVGGENMTGFTQKDPIVAASDPWGSRFDSTMAWGPVQGAMYYMGFRINFEKF